MSVQLDEAGQVGGKWACSCHLEDAPPLILERGLTSSRSQKQIQLVQTQLAAPHDDLDESEPT